jgi:mRNA interferase MazF
MMNIERGWFYLADLRPRRGTEPGKARPVLALQSDLLNQTGHPSTIVAPLTSNTVDDAEPLRVRVGSGAGLRKPSDVMIDQVRVIDNRRLCHPKTGKLLKRIAPASADLIRSVESCLKLVLDLS